jgi:hypothetical protein
MRYYFCSTNLFVYSMNEYDLKYMWLPKRSCVVVYSNRYVLCKLTHACIHVRLVYISDENSRENHCASTIAKKVYNLYLSMQKTCGTLYCRGMNVIFFPL